MIESLQSLQPDPQVEMLRAILQQMQTSGNGSTNVQAPIPPFQLTGSAIRVNVYWFSSLVISLSTALFTILAKQWVNYLLAGLSPVPSTQGRHRQYRTDGLHKWHLPAIIAFLPLLLHISLVLFFVGLVDFVWSLNDGIGAAAAALVVATLLVYFATNLLSYIYPDCPFKTSVTVIISLVHDLWAITSTSISVKVQVVTVSLKTISRHVARVARAPRRLARRTLKIAVSEVQESASIVDSEKPKYNSLRISSLRYQDNRFISQNTSLVDARVLIWMTHNVGRLADPKDLGYAVMRFPHLIRHRHLLMSEGVSAFLERLLKLWFNAPWPELGDSQRRGVISSVRTLGMMFSEAEVDTEDFAESTLPRGTVVDSTPYLPVQRVQQNGQNGHATLSPHTLRLVSHLLANLRGLPLPLAAFTLRLSVHLTENERKQLGFDKLVEDFLQQVMDFSSASRSRSELIPAVNTVIYLSLFDAARPPGATSPLVSSSDIRYWLTILLNVMHRAPMDSVVLRQLCWAMCSLAWALSPQANGVTVRALVPRLHSQHSVARAMAELLSCDQDPDVLSTAVVALECILWNIGTDAKDDHAQLCAALQERYTHFLTEILRRLVSKELPTSRVARVLVSLTRITAYLSFFDPGGPDDAKISLSATTFSILNHLVLEKPGVDAVSPKEVHQHTAGHPDAGVLDLATRLWTYRAVCRMVALYLNDPRWKPEFQGPSPSELLYRDGTESAIAVGDSIASAVTALSSPPTTEPRWRALQPYTLDTFCSIVKNAFTIGLRPNTDVRAVGGWDRESEHMLSEAIRSRDLLGVLLACQHVSVHVEVLVPAVHHVYATLFAGLRPIVLDTAPRHPNELESNLQITTLIKPMDKRHPARQMSRALQETFLPFLQKFTQELKDGSHAYAEMHDLLAELICIAGYSVFFDRPSELPRPAMLRTMAAYLRTLAQTQKLPVTVRRHAWGAIGSMAALYLLPASELTAEDNPVRHFRFDRASPEEVALGFVTIFAIYANVRTPPNATPPDAHCAECALDPDAFAGDPRRWQAEEGAGVSVCAVLAEAALEMAIDVWDGADWEAGATRARLAHHDAGTLVRVLSLAEGAVGALADRLATRIEMTRTSGSSVQRRLTL